MSLSRIRLLEKVSMQFRRWRIIFLLVAASMGYGLYLGAQASLGVPEGKGATHAGPHLIIGVTRHDFGRVTAGTVLRREFIVENGGTTRLVISQNVGGCCGDDRMDDYAIVPPGRQLTIPVTLDTSGTIGPQRRVLRFSTSDPKRPRIEFTLTASVVDTLNRQLPVWPNTMSQM